MPERSELVNQLWDVIIVGTGMGGGTLGYALARAGLKVLFCEKGKSRLKPGTLQGKYAEDFFQHIRTPLAEDRPVLLDAGRYPEEINDCSSSPSRRFVPFVGMGSGGSTSLYGMALERLFPSDFIPKDNYLNIPETSLPEKWPFSYETLSPYYDAAEMLYRVRGSLDPLRGQESRNHLLHSPDLSESGSEIFHFFKQKGLHPYRLPMACEFVPGCECCQGYICPRECKNDSFRICLKPAITKHGATLLDGCEVVKLEATRTEVTHVICNLDNHRISLRGKYIVLAAGALESPCILLRSTSDIWPHGLANDSGLVGRNLMRHHIDLYAVAPHAKNPDDNRHKEFAFNDYYHTKERKLGSVQSFGRLPPGKILVESLEDDIRHSAFRWVAPGFRFIKPLMAPIVDRMFERKLILATTLEDLPYFDNKVTPSTSSTQNKPIISISYCLHRHDRIRIDSMRKLMAKTLKPYSFSLIKQAENNQRIAHACGTCRFGEDPTNSVLDPFNRAHGLSNLYVVDSSFFPSSGGTNPSLTIAAVALRVAEHLISRYSSTTQNGEN